MAVTLKMIAAQTGVSPMVVSAALHNTAGIRMSNEKRKLILHTAAEMGYQPNLLARSLSGGSSRIIGVVIDSMAPNSFFEVLRYIEAAATEKGYQIMVAEEHDSVHQVASACRKFEQYAAEGVICLAHDYPKQQKEAWDLLKGIRHLVLLGRGEGIECSYVEQEPSRAFREILRHWQTQGRRPGFFISGSQFSQTKRVKCYQSICDELGIESAFFAPAFGVAPKEILADMHRGLDEFVLPRKINALLIQNDLYSAAMLSALAERGIRCPGDIAVFGWDNDPFCDVLIPPLASIDQNYAEQGRLLVELLLAEIAGKERRHETIHMRTIWRESAGLAPAESI